jgi:hypothetical protein
LHRENPAPFWRRFRSEFRRRQAFLTGSIGARREARMRVPERAVSSLQEPVAQPVEHVTFNHGVLGSSPSGLTKKIKGLQEDWPRNIKLLTRFLTMRRLSEIASQCARREMRGYD